MTRVFVHIHTLRLIGVEHGSSRGIAEGLQQELASALAESGIPAALMSDKEPVARLHVGPVRLTRNTTPHRVGALVARSVAAGVAS
jgi:hypothetical protein